MGENIFMGNYFDFSFFQGWGGGENIENYFAARGGGNDVFKKRGGGEQNNFVRFGTP